MYFFSSFKDGRSQLPLIVCYLFVLCSSNGANENIDKEIVPKRMSEIFRRKKCFSIIHNSSEQTVNKILQNLLLIRPDNLQK